MNKKIILKVAADCCLQNAPPSLINGLKRRLTIANPKYRDARKYGRWIGKKLKPYLYYYKEWKDGFHFPRGFARQAVQLSRKILKHPAILLIEDRRRRLPEVDFVFHGKLRSYQKKAVHHILKHDFGVLESGTGSGKTIIALAVIAQRRQPTIIIVHSKELLYQWLERIREFLGVEAGCIGDGRFDIKPVTVAIVNSARNRLDELPAQFGQVCVDECHRVPASLFTDVVTAFDCTYSLGLSATAYRRDGLTNLIYYYLGERSYQVNPEDLHISGAVLKPVFIQRPTHFSYSYRGNYQALMKALTENTERNRQIARDIIAEAKRGSGTVLVVSDRVAHCEQLRILVAEENKREGTKSFEIAVLTGQLPAEGRAKVVDRIHNGDIDILIATLQLIGEGFDCPGLSTLFLTTPIKFSGRLLQVVGRILRPEEDKQPKVFDYVDQSKVLQSSAQIRSHTFQTIWEPQSRLPL